MKKKLVIHVFLLMSFYNLMGAQTAPKWSVQIIWQMPVDCVNLVNDKEIDQSNFFQYMFGSKSPAAMSSTYGKLQYNYYQLTGQVAPGATGKGTNNGNNRTTVFENKNYFNQYVVGPYYTAGYNTSELYITKPQFPNNDGEYTAAILRGAFLGLYRGSSNSKLSNLQNNLIEGTHWCLVGCIASVSTSSHESLYEKGVADNPLDPTLGEQQVKQDDSVVSYINQARNIYNSSKNPPNIKMSCNDIMSTFIGTNKKTGSFPVSFQATKKTFGAQGSLTLNSFRPVEGVKMLPAVYFGGNISFRLHLITPGRQIELNHATRINDVVNCQNTYTDMLQEVDPNGWGF